MSDVSMHRPRGSAADAAIALALSAAGTVLAYACMQAFRAAHLQPWFYQGNFEPAVMMACGRGFHTTTSDAIPASLRAFLALARNDFSCADLRPDLPLVQVTWNGTWYYLYGICALIWKFTGISWTALDGLVAVFAGVTTASVYGLFRLVSSRLMSIAGAALMTLSPVNLGQLLYLRDYSKSSFVLSATFVLGLMVLRPMSRRTTVALAALYGTLVGVGYGFRTDLIVMAPFGVVMLLLFLPGGWRATIRTRATAAAAAVIAFLVLALPPLHGLKTTGGCQFHYSLLGLTSPLVHEAGVEPALYSFGDHFTDTFIDMKVGDYANRILHQPAPNLCSPEYDVASGALFRQLALTFPADLAVHAYGAVLIITRAGVNIPNMNLPLPRLLDWRATRFGYRWLNRMTESLTALGPIVTALGVAVAWSVSIRLGLALTAFVLFLGGYPAIEFEGRHWFHLRFIPWWSLTLVGTAMFRGRSVERVDSRWLRGAIGVGATVLALALALAALRAAQSRTLSAMVARYQGATTAPVDVTRRGAVVDVDWRPLDYGTAPEHRSSDILVLTLDAARCGSDDPLRVQVQYDFDNQAHDLSTTISIARPFPGQRPARVFVPVFAAGIQDHAYMRFRSFEISGASAECLARVERMVDRGALPIWLQVQLPSDWQDRGLYQRLRTPRIFR